MTPIAADKHDDPRYESAVVAAEQGETMMKETLEQMMKKEDVDKAGITAYVKSLKKVAADVAKSALPKRR